MRSVSDVTASYKTHLTKDIHSFLMVSLRMTAGNTKITKDYKEIQAVLYQKIEIRQADHRNANCRENRMTKYICCIGKRRIFEEIARVCQRFRQN